MDDIIVGDEISRSLTHVNRLRSAISDAHSRKDYRRALDLANELSVHVKNAIAALEAEQLIERGRGPDSLSRARRAMNEFNTAVCWPDARDEA